jgi:hypothetical protein
MSIVLLCACANETADTGGTWDAEHDGCGDEPDRRFDYSTDLHADGVVYLLEGLELQSSDDMICEEVCDDWPDAEGPYLIVTIDSCALDFFEVVLVTDEGPGERLVGTLACTGWQEFGCD